MLEQEKLPEAQIDRILSKLFVAPAVQPIRAAAQSPDDDDEEDKVMRSLESRKGGNRQSGLFGY